mgnify:CR=1
MTSDQTEVSALFQTLIRAFCYCLTVQRKYAQMKMELSQVRRHTKAPSEGKDSVVLQNILRYIVLSQLFCSRLVPPLVCLFGTYCNIVTIEKLIILFLFLGILLSFFKKLNCFCI